MTVAPEPWLGEAVALKEVGRVESTPQESGPSTMLATLDTGTPG